MMTGHIMPVDAIVVKVVEYRNAVFGSATLLSFSIIRLGATDTSCFGPVVLISLGGGCQFLEHSSPEPTVYVVGLEIGAFAAFEVTKAARGPDIFDLEQKNL